MAHYQLDQEVIKNYLDTNENFDTVADFCDYLEHNWKENTDIKTNLRKMVYDKIVNMHKEERPVINKIARLEDWKKWLSANCYFHEGEADPKQKTKDQEVDTGNTQNKESEAEPEVKAIIQQSAFEEIKRDFKENDCKRLKPIEEDCLDYSYGKPLREGGIITQHNQWELYLTGDMWKNIQIEESKILLIREEGDKVLALGYLEQIDDTTYSVIFDNKKCIDYEAFQGIRRARYVIYDKKKQPYSRQIDLEYEPFGIEEVRPLCIDFGTSNTSVGSYGILGDRDEAEIVSFIDVTVTPNNKKAVLLPTIVYVDDCSDQNDIKYLFGYEARKKVEKEHYASKASVYYEIKRWLPSAEEIIEIHDNNNNLARPKKQDIIKAYMDYVIQCAEQYFGTRFRKIHFSAPVKWKELFIERLAKMYHGEKQVLTAEESIDEGIAIVYNQIISLAEREHKDKSKNKKSIMIMDCGGGTTDLASCEYYYTDTTAGREFIINTCFENGNSNFGGNNITYRIMQLLKIKIAAAFSEGLIDDNGRAKSLIPKSENDILGLVEDVQKSRYDSDKINSEVYEKFIENYNKAERVIPTQYVDNRTFRGTESLKKIKRNFHYLWRKAEEIKIEFFKAERVLMKFDGTQGDSVINFDHEDNYYLYVVEGTSLKEKKQPFETVEITIKEINRVICGDIYSLLVGLFLDQDETQDKAVKKVDEFDYYKLSGQSCKISLFSELIKEYIPGRKLRAVKGIAKEGKRSSEDLKLDCVLGCIHYVRDQLRPELNVITNANPPKVIYNILLKGTYGGDKLLFDCSQPNKIRYTITPANTRELPLVVKSQDDILEREFIFQLKEKGKEEWNQSELREKFIKQSGIEKRSEEEQRKFCNMIDEFLSELDTKEVKGIVNLVFIIPSPSGYGVWIGQLEMDDSNNSTIYKFLRFTYENFEDSSKTFFDGRR